MQQANRTVLVVDDDWGVREMLGVLLADAGYANVAARNGREALDYLRQAEKLPCLILLDMMLPDVSGVQFLIKKQEDPRLADIKIVVMTANADLVRAGEMLGVSATLEKPFDTAILCATIARLCE
jgi:CheY-like chemotaxis protein